MRERLLADGHLNAGVGGRRRREHACASPGSRLKSRKDIARPPHQRRVYVTGCASNLASDAFVGLPENVTVVAKRSEETPAFVAGDVGAIACSGGRATDRVRAFVKVQDGCSFSCSFCVIRRTRLLPQPQC